MERIKELEQKVAEVESLNRQYETTISRLRADAELAQKVKAEKKKAPRRTSFGAKNRIFTKEMVIEADDYITRAMSRLNANPMADPELIKHLVVKIGYLLEGGARVAYDSVSATLKAQFPKLSDDLIAEAYRVAKEKTFRVGVDDIVNAMKEAVEEGLADGEQRKYIIKLIDSIVESGVHDFDAVYDAAFRAAKEVFPDITRDEVIQHYSHYGESTPAPTDIESVRKSQLKTEGQLYLGLEDIIARHEAALASGSRRQGMSDLARRLKQQINEKMKELGITVASDPAKQLAGALQAAKTRITNQIKDIRFEIASKQRIVKGKTVLLDDAELVSLRAELVKLKAERKAVFGNKTLTDAQRVAMLTKVKERNAMVWQGRLERAKEGDFSSGKQAVRKVTSPELEAIQAQIDAAKQEVKELQRLANPGMSPEEKALQAYKTRLLKRMADYADRMARGDFEPKKRTEIKLDRATSDLAYIADQIKQEYYDERHKVYLAKLTALEKAGATVQEIINLHRAYYTSMDLSSQMRQGGFLSMGDPVLYYKMLLAQVKSFVSEGEAFRIEQQMREHPDYGFWKKAGLEFTGDALAGRRPSAAHSEEAYQGRWERKTPLVHQSGRAFATGLDYLRFNKAVWAKKVIETFGGKMSDGEANAIAKMINVSTGRTGLNMGASKVANLFLFAAKLWHSRLLMATGAPLWAKGNTWRTRTFMVMTYAQYLAGLTVLVNLAKMGGATFNTDTNSSGFGKLRWGLLSLDLTVGMGTLITAMSRTITGKKTTSRGKIVHLVGKDVSFGGETMADVWFEYVRGKLNPTAGEAANIGLREDFYGDPISFKTEVLRLILPMSVGNVAQISTAELSPFQKTFASIFELLGTGTGLRRKTAEDKFREAFKNKDRGKVSEVIREEVNAGNSPEAAFNKAFLPVDVANYSTFEYEQAMDVYLKSTPENQKRYKPFLRLTLEKKFNSEETSGKERQRIWAFILENKILENR